jgi:hypothetical protein
MALSFKSGAWATLSLHPNERISFYGCRTPSVFEGPGLDAASLLNLCGNHYFRSGHAHLDRSALLPRKPRRTTDILPTHQRRRRGIS